MQELNGDFPIPWKTATSLSESSALKHLNMSMLHLYKPEAEGLVESSYMWIQSAG